MNGAFLVDGIRVESRLNRIHGRAGTIQIEPKIMRVLLRLARSPGEVVSKDELIEAAWPDTSATDDVLARAISELRKAFGDDSRAPRVIETIRKGGYRLLARVEHPPPRSTARAAAALAVLGIVLAAGAAWVYWPSTIPHPPTTQPLTHFKGVERDPAISPNGAMVAFSWQGPDQDNWDIYVKLREQETPQRLTQSPAEDGSPAWSSDGSRIAFRRRGEAGCRLWVVPAIGGDERALANCQSNGYADLVWSPDGRWLAHNDSVGEGLHAIMLVDAEDGSAHPVSSPPAGIWGDFDPAFSPDSSQLAFARAQSEGIQDLFVLPLAGGPERQITFDARNIYGLTWAPDGQSIIFASNRRGDYDLWKVSVDGGPPVALLGGPGNLVNPVVDRDGSHLVYEHRRYDFDVLRYDLEPGPGQANPAVAASSTRWELYPAVSPSGRRLAFSSDRSGRYEIWFSDIDGGSPRRLTDFGGSLVSAPAWSPDGSRLAFDARPEGNADLYLIDPDGGPPEQLTRHPADDLAPSWSRDGRWVLFGSNRGGQWQIWRIAAEGGTPEQLTHQGGYHALDSEHGIFYTRFGEAGLWSMADESRRFDFPDPVDWGNWHVGSAGVYQLDRSAGGPPWIVLHPWEGPSQRLLQASQQVPTGDAALTVSGDGKTLLLGEIQQRWVDLMMVRSPPL